MRVRALLAIVLASFGFSNAVRADPVDTAFSDAIALFERAAPALGTMPFGVDLVAFRDALSLGRFNSTHWGGTMLLDLRVETKVEGGCRDYAAFVRLPPRQGRVTLVICPEFSTPGTPELRRLTIIHEMVHVVAGADECRAMAFAAAVETAALGRFTPVDRYWQTKGCAGSGFGLPQSNSRSD